MLDGIKEAVLKAGGHLLKAGKTNYQTFNKEGRGEYVTQCDLEVQNMLKESLLALCPEACFVGEEGNGTQQDKESPWRFIVDPIDGTNNFIRGYRHSAISVALSFRNEIRIGVIYDPYLDEIFYAEKGGGAFCNGQPIGIIQRPLHKSIIIFGTASYNRSHTEATFALLRSLFDRAEDLRNGGSAALDLCYVASGRGDIFFEYSLCPWDYAAGWIILTEAGGIMETLEGKIPELTGKSSIIATTPSLLAEIKLLGLPERPLSQGNNKGGIA